MAGGERTVQGVVVKMEELITMVEIMKGMLKQVTPRCRMYNAFECADLERGDLDLKTDAATPRKELNSQTLDDLIKTVIDRYPLIPQIQDEQYTCFVLQNELAQTSRIRRACRLRLEKSVHSYRPDVVLAYIIDRLHRFH